MSSVECADSVDCTDSPIRIEISVIDALKKSNSKLETSISDILSKFECLKRSVSKAPSFRNPATNSRDRKPADWRSPHNPHSTSTHSTHSTHATQSKPAAAAAASINDSWQQQQHATDAKRPRIGVSSDPGLRAITSLLNKINDGNFETIKNQVVKLVLDGGVQVRVAIDALLEKSATDGDGFTMAYAKLLASVASASENQNSLRCISRISEFLQEIYGSSSDNDDALWKEIASVAEATVRFKPTENYDGFCAAIKAKKRIFGRHRTALSILTLMGKDVSGVPTPLDAVSKLISLMKRAVRGDDDDKSIREASIEILLELVHQLSHALVMVKKEAFVSALKSLKSGMSDVLTKEIILACGSQCRFRAESVFDKLAELLAAASPSAAVRSRSSRPVAWQSSGEAVKAALIVCRNSANAPASIPSKPAIPAKPAIPGIPGGSSWRSIVASASKP